MSKESQDLGGALLASVSRSFYLSIKILPREVRESLGLSYLLARMADTIADTAEAPSKLRLKHLQAFQGMILSGADREKILLLQKEIIPSDKAELKLLTKIEACLEWLHAQPPEDRKDIVNVLEKIIYGQELDIVRFPGASHPRALQNGAELDEYTYLVAGCVGEFWTRICCRHLERYAKIDSEKLCGLGINFGKGLQLVNILRDMPADLRAGRCYLPADELKLSGVEPTSVHASGKSVQPVFDRWLEKAAAHLEEAFQYIESIASRRVRIACILPWFIGMRTLVLLKQNFPLTTDKRVKVTRAEVRKLLFLAPVAALSDKFLRRMRTGLNRDLAEARATDAT
ncbi:MAG: phytoene/squalene synthase family protein [Chthoniobacteraceae bacterium]